MANVGESIVRPDRMVALGQFLQYLANAHDLGDAPVRALVVGGLSPLDAVAGNLYISDGQGSIVLAGSDGFSADEIEGYATIALNLPFPLTAAFNTRVPVFVSADSIVRNYPLMATTEVESVSEAEALGLGPAQMVAVPLLWQGVPIGVVGIVSHKQGTWDPVDMSYLNAVCCALTVWVAGKPEAHSALHGHRPARSGRQLSERQRQILDLIAAGKSNASIAASLGYSVSTVKADVAGLLVTLGATDRQRAVEVARELALID